PRLSSHRSLRAHRVRIIRSGKVRAMRTRARAFRHLARLRARAVRELCAERRGAFSQEHRADPPPTRIATDTAFAEEGGRAVPARMPLASTHGAIFPKN